MTIQKLQRKANIYVNGEDGENLLHQGKVVNQLRSKEHFDNGSHVRRKPLQF